MTSTLAHKKNWKRRGGRNVKGNELKTAYGLKTRTRLGMAEAEAKVRELLAFVEGLCGQLRVTGPEDTVGIP